MPSSHSLRSQLGSISLSLLNTSTIFPSLANSARATSTPAFFAALSARTRSTSLKVHGPCPMDDTPIILIHLNIADSRPELREPTGKSDVWRNSELVADLSQRHRPTPRQISTDSWRQYFGAAREFRRLQMLVDLLNVL